MNTYALLLTPIATAALFAATAWAQQTPQPAAPAQTGAPVATQTPAQAGQTPPAGQTSTSRPAAPATHPRKAAGGDSAAAEPVKPAGPKPPQEFQQDLAAGFAASPYAGDAITASVEAGAVTLTGTVHSAERKGLATRLVRSLAQKDGWTEVHVWNKLEVKLNP